MALRRAWIIVLMVVVATAAGFAYGSSRTLSYKAQVQLVAGPIVSSPQSLAGDVDSTVDLAASYSRLGSTQRVQQAVAQKLDVSTAEVAGAVDVSAVDGNPTVRIESNAPTRAMALAYARTTGDTLRELVADEISPERLGRRQLSEYRSATADVNRAQAELDELRSRDSDSATGDALQSARADLDSAQLRQQVAASIYTSGRQNAQQVVGLSSFDGARALGDNRSDQRLRWSVFGAIFGLAVGLALATAAALLHRRRLGRP